MSIKTLFALSVFILLNTQSTIQQPNEFIASFSKAKVLLHKVIHSESASRKTFYCGCSYDEKLNVDFESCGYIPGKNRKRAKRVEWEHIVPASVFGRKFSEWNYGHPDCVDNLGKKFKGRNCASKMNKLYQLMQADMYNLVPAIGEINADRSNFSFGIVSGEKREYGACDFEIGNRTAEPAENIRGDIARIYMYMDSAYPGFDIITEKNRKMIEIWNNSDPVDLKECKINRDIEKIQGNQNLILKTQCDELLKTSQK